MMYEIEEQEDRTIEDQMIHQQYWMISEDARRSYFNYKEGNVNGGT